MPQCLSAAVPELCRDCIRPACAAGKFEDPIDTVHARFHAAFRQCVKVRADYGGERTCEILASL